MASSKRKLNISYKGEETVVSFYPDTGYAELKDHVYARIGLLSKDRVVFVDAKDDDQDLVLSPSLPDGTRLKAISLTENGNGLSLDKDNVSKAVAVTKPKSPDISIPSTYESVIMVYVVAAIAVIIAVVNNVFPEECPASWTSLEGFIQTCRSWHPPLKKAIHGGICWGITYFGIRKVGNPQMRHKWRTFIVDVHFGILANVVNVFLKDFTKNFI